MALTVAFGVVLFSIVLFGFVLPGIREDVVARRAKPEPQNVATWLDRQPKITTDHRFDLDPARFRRTLYAMVFWCAIGLGISALFWCLTSLIRDQYGAEGESWRWARLFTVRHHWHRHGLHVGRRWLPHHRGTTGP
jgi:hypothetical protein